MTGTNEYHSRVSLRSRLWTREARLAYMLLAPSLLFLFGFMLYPLLYVFLMSLHRTNNVGKLLNFTGLSNYAQVMRDRQFWIITGRTVMWTALGVGAKMVLGIVVALLLNVEFRGRRAARLLFMIPWASSIPISVLLWQWVYTPEFGLLDHTLVMTHLWMNPPTWLGKPVSAFISELWVDVWLGLPFMALVFLAGMQSIPEELYESAYLDGVNAFQKFFYITLPGIRHIVLIATLLSSLWTFNDFNVIYILTKGGPADTTEILVTAIYNNAFQYLHFSRAAVMAVVTFVILTIVSTVYARFYFSGEDSQ